MTGPGITFRSAAEMVADGTIRPPACLNAEPEATSEAAHLAAAIARQVAADVRKRGPSAGRLGRVLH